MCLRVCAHSRACGNALLCCLFFCFFSCAALSALQRGPLPLHVNYSTHTKAIPQENEKNTRNNCIPETILMFSGTQALTLACKHAHTHVRNIDILFVFLSIWGVIFSHEIPYIIMVCGTWSILRVSAECPLVWSSERKYCSFSFSSSTLTPISTKDQQGKV